VVAVVAHFRIKQRVAMVGTRHHCTQIGRQIESIRRRLGFEVFVKTQPVVHRQPLGEPPPPGFLLPGIQQRKVEVAGRIRCKPAPQIRMDRRQRRLREVDVRQHMEGRIRPQFFPGGHRFVNEIA
jgi:hypothetical protein